MTFADIRWDLCLVGVGLFLFGIVLMSGGLKSLAGEKLREYINKYTNKPWQGILVGAVITALIQSSTATTTIVVGFVRAGLMTLEQAIGVIIGANIGTTFTVFLISLNINAIAPFLIFAGAFFLMYAKKKKFQDIAYILIGFGLIFFGIQQIEENLIYLKEIPQFMEFTEMCAENPFIGLLGGAIITVCFQSSAAAIGLMQVVYESGAITFGAVIPFLFGSNIGTCVAAQIVSLGGNVSSRRTAMAHLLFNVLGSIIGLLLINQLIWCIDGLTALFNLNAKMQIAYVHIIFNVFTCIIVYPFIKQFTKLIKKILPGQEPKRIEINMDGLNPQNFPVAATAISVAYEYIVKLKDLVRDNVENVRQYYLGKSSDDDYDNIKQTERVIDKLQHSIERFVTKIPVDQMSDAGLRQQNLCLEVAKNLERIGDLADNVSEFGRMINEDKSGKMSKEAYDELNHLFEIFYGMYDAAFDYMNNLDEASHDKVYELEEEMDRLEYVYRQNHFDRMKKGDCTTTVGSSVYADILSNLERMADHCRNIVRITKERSTTE